MDFNWYKEVLYIAFASINNKMVPSDAVIGIGNPSFRVDRYDMIDKSDPGVLRMDAKYQTLVNASFGDSMGQILHWIATMALMDHLTIQWRHWIAK